jgi:hypothetical protein
MGDLCTVLPSTADVCCIDLKTITFRWKIWQHLSLGARSVDAISHHSPILFEFYNSEPRNVQSLQLVAGI